MNQDIILLLPILFPVFAGVLLFWKKLLPKKHIVPYRYFSTNDKVASVSKTGKIKGKKKGTCTIYVVATNGVKKSIKVTVR